MYPLSDSSVFHLGSSVLYPLSEDGSSNFDQNSLSKRQISRKVSVNSDLDSSSGSARRMRTISELSDHNVSKFLLKNL